MYMRTQTRTQLKVRAPFSHLAAVAPCAPTRPFPDHGATPAHGSAPGARHAAAQPPAAARAASRRAAHGSTPQATFVCLFVCCIAVALSTHGERSWCAPTACGAGQLRPVGVLRRRPSLPHARHRHDSFRLQARLQGCRTSSSPSAPARSHRAGHRLVAGGGVNRVLPEQAPTSRSICPCGSSELVRCAPSCATAELRAARSPGGIYDTDAWQSAAVRGAVVHWRSRADWDCFVWGIRMS